MRLRMKAARGLEFGKDSPESESGHSAGGNKFAAFVTNRRFRP